MKHILETEQEKNVTKEGIRHNLLLAIDSVGNDPNPDWHTFDFILRMKKMVTKIDNPSSYLDTEGQLRFK